MFEGLTIWEEETFQVLEEYGYGGQKAGVKHWYDGFVLGLVVDLAEEYVITSNRESGLDRYDVVIEPQKAEGDAFILEFKVQDTEDESVDRVDRKRVEIILEEQVNV